MLVVELGVTEQRYKAVAEVLQAHVPVTVVAERYGVSRQSVHAWIRAYRADGMEGLLDRSHRPKNIPQQIDPVIEAEICEMRRAHPRYGPVTILYWLANKGVSPLPSRTTAYRVLVRNNLITPISRKRKRDSYVRWERDVSMELWQLDFIKGVFLADGTECKVVTGLDDHSSLLRDRQGGPPGQRRRDCAPRTPPWSSSGRLTASGCCRTLSSTFGLDPVRRTGWLC